MRQIFSKAGPDILGLIILGGAIGATLGGAGPAQLGPHAAFTAALGSLILPALCSLRWPRRARATANPTA